SDRSRQNERYPSSRFDAPVRERHEHASEASGSACADSAHDPLELGLELATLIRQGTEQQISADAPHEGRVHHDEVKLRDRRVRDLRLSGSGLHGLKLRIIERHLRANFASRKEVETAEAG